MDDRINSHSTNKDIEEKVLNSLENGASKKDIQKLQRKLQEKRKL